MVEPYVRKDPGDIIRAQDWNDMQSRARDAIEGHTHTGGAQGPLLTGAGIDPATAVKVKSVTADSLSVAGADLSATLKRLLDQVNAALPLAGGTIAGELLVQKGIRLADSDIRLRGGGDDYHGLGYYNNDKRFAGQGVDGPVLYGTFGGGLGSTDGGQRLALTWDAQQNVAVKKALSVSDSITAAGSDIYFTKTDHDHTGKGNTAGFAAIENAKSHDALMILGRAGSKMPDGGTGRYVRLWDYLSVEGGLQVTGLAGFPGGVRMRDVDIALRGGTDPNHGIGWYGGDKHFAATSPDGPILYGYSGGGLGSTSGEQRLALTWDAQRNVTVAGTLSINSTVQVNKDGPSFPLLQIKRNNNDNTGGKSVFLELFQHDTLPAAVAPVYPSIRFHHAQRFWCRIEAREDGLHFKTGDTNSDDYGDIRVSRCLTPSDARLKMDFNPIRQALTTLRSVEAVQFRWRADGPGGRLNIGVVAQELETVWPELVHTGCDGHKAVNYAGLTAVLLAAVKEQQHEIESLKQRLPQP